MLGELGFEQAVLMGLIGSLILWSMLILAAVMRLRNKLSPESKPTVWTYLNELGGYAVVGVILAGMFLWRLVQAIWGP